MTRTLLAGLLVLTACSRVASAIDFERMIDQAKYEAYEAGPPGFGVAVMRVPPEGTVPRERVLGRVELDERGEYRSTIPLTVDMQLLQRGRDRFERFCGACHGVLGDGNPPVVENMALRPPPSLHEQRILEQPPGRIYSTITHGYGLMPSYAEELEPNDRWAVVAYLRALWLSQSARLAELPPELQQEAARALP